MHFSVAKCGEYLLYVSLHGQSPQNGTSHSIPGSPFALHVAPGPAHPLTTQIGSSELPLRASLEAPKLEKELQNSRVCSPNQRQFF